MRRLSLLLASLVAAGALAGCAGTSSSSNAKDFSGAKKDVAQAVDDFSSAGSKRDAKKLCTSILSQQLIDQLNQGTRDCQAVVGDQLKDADSYSLDVKSIAITGDTATAQVTSKVDGKDQPQTLKLTRQNGTWRISGLGS